MHVRLRLANVFFLTILLSTFISEPAHAAGRFSCALGIAKKVVGRMLGAHARAASSRNSTPRSNRARLQLEAFESRLVPATTPTPAYLTATGETTLTGQFTLVDDAVGYEAYLTNIGTGEQIQLYPGTTEDTIYFTDLAPGTDYQLDVFSYDIYGDYSDSAYAVATTFGGGETYYPPSAPSDLGYYYADGFQVAISWQPGSIGTTGYAIEKSTDGGDFIEIDSVDASFTYYVDYNVLAGQEVQYRVRGYDEYYYSDYTNTLALIVPLDPSTNPGYDPGNGGGYQPLPFDLESNQRFIGNLYRDVLGRDASSAEIDGWITAMRGGADRAAVASGFIGSTEFRQTTVIGYYRSVLGRDFYKGEVGAAEIAGWVNNRNLSLDKILNYFLASDEFYGKSGGTDEQYIDAVYRVLLTRNSEPAGNANWVGLLQAGNSRLYVVGNIALSQEGINNVYRRFLRRDADPVGLAGFLTAYQTGVTLDMIKVSVLASDEYFQRPD